MPSNQVCDCSLSPRVIHLAACGGLRHWCEFASAIYGSAERAFPPTIDAIVGWSHTFRCLGTFSNYLGYLRSACLAMDVAAPPTNDPLIRRAKSAIVKRMLWSPRRARHCTWFPFACLVHTCRPRMFIQRQTVLNMVLAVGRGLEEQRYAMLWLAAYTFLLRVPSEGFPMCCGGGASSRRAIAPLS